MSISLPSTAAAGAVAAAVSPSPQTTSSMEIALASAGMLVEEEDTGNESVAVGKMEEEK